jgi:hypothetical protein
MSLDTTSLVPEARGDPRAPAEKPSLNNDGYPMRITLIPPRVRTSPVTP